MLYIIQKATKVEDITLWKDHSIKTSEEWGLFCEDRRTTWVLLPPYAIGKYIRVPNNAKPRIEHYYGIYSGDIWRVTIVPNLCAE